jgi:hypothetical protein
MFSRNNQKRYGRYIQEEENLSLDEVIKRGIADLKERLADDDRLTVQRVIDHKKRELASSAATSCIQTVDRTAFYTKNGYPTAAQIDDIQKEQVITHHLSSYTRPIMAGTRSPSGVLLKPTSISAKEGKPSPIIFTPSTGVGSIGFSSQRDSNTTRALPARLEPLFYAFVTNHEEGHALDALLVGDEVDHSNIYKKVFEKDIDEAVRVLEGISQKEVALTTQASFRDSWLKSLCETRQDVYGLLKTAEFAKSEGYGTDDMLALIDYVHDVRITSPAQSMQHYCVHTGIAATRHLIENRGLDAVEYIMAKGEPQTPKEKEIFKLHGRQLHFGVREWVYERELYMEGGAYTAFNHFLEEGELPCEGVLKKRQKETLMRTLDEREKATQRILRPQSSEHITLEDAQTLNAIIARQADQERQGLELLAMSDGTCKALEHYKNEDQLDTVFGRFVTSRHDYMNQLVLSGAAGFMDKLKEPEAEIQAPSAILYIDKTKEEEGKKPQNLLITLRQSPVNGDFIMESSPAPFDTWTTAQISDHAYQNNIVVSHVEDVPAIKTMVASAHYYGALQDADGAYKKTKFSAELEDDTARKAYIALNDVFEGKEHRLDAYEGVFKQVIKTGELDSEEEYLKSPQAEKIELGR